MKIRDVKNREVRMRQMLRHLQAIGAVRFQTDLSQVLDLTPTEISVVLSGGDSGKLSRFLDKLEEAFPNVFNRSYLEIGEGDLLCESASSSLIVNGDANAIGIGNVVFVGDGLEQDARRMRFLDAVDALINQSYIKNKADLAQVVGIAPSTISKIISGDSRYFTPTQLERFNRAFGGMFNVQYLLTGEGQLMAEVNGNNNAIGVGNTTLSTSKRSGRDSITNNHNTTNNYNVPDMQVVINQYEATISRLETTIKNQQETINRLLDLLQKH